MSFISNNLYSRKGPVYVPATGTPFCVFIPVVRIAKSLRLPADSCGFTHWDGANRCILKKVC
jgi:hypothetical protein